MAKQLKNKSKEKVVEKDNASKTVKKKKCCCCSRRAAIIIASLAAVALAVVSYKLYSEYLRLATVPDMPKLDLNAWWGPNTTEQDTSIRPFRIMFPDAMQEEIAKKFEIYRSVVRKKSISKDWTYGVHSESLAQILAHWLFKTEYRERVRFLNQFNHFKTNIQGLDIHFVHVKPKVDKNVKVLPLLLLHGWPDSIRGFYEAIPLLTTVRPEYDFVFEIIVPSLPGFIYSQAPIKQGLHAAHIAIIMRNLMQRLGFKQYYVQGGDFGHLVGSHIATLFSNEVLGFHTNFPGNFSELGVLVDTLCRLFSYFFNGSVEQNTPFKDLVEFYIEETGYMHLQGTKPDTLGIALNDSPVGLLAYIIDRFMVFTDHNNKFLEDGGLSKYFTYTSLLDNVMLYWFSGSITTSMRIYKETFNSTNNNLEEILARTPTSVPTWALHLKYELVHHPDFILRWKYPALVGTTTLDFGGHFAAFERPKEFADDVFLAVSKFRFRG